MSAPVAIAGGIAPCQLTRRMLESDRTCNNSPNKFQLVHILRMIKLCVSREISESSSLLSDEGCIESIGLRFSG